MTAGWTPTRLGAVAKIKHGFAFSGMAESSDSNLPVVVGIGNFDYAGGFRFESTNLKRYVGDYPAAFKLEPGDVLLAMTCQTPGGEILGVAGTIPNDGQIYLHNQRLGKVEILDPERAHLPFIFQLSRWETFNQHLFATSSGSKILHTSPGRIEDFTLQLPPLSEQREIAATLCALDDKIESNRRASSLLVQLALTSLGNGVEHVRVGDFATVRKGLSYKGSGLDDGTSADARPMLNLASFTKTGAVKPDGTKWYTGEFKPHHKLRAWDLVLANTDLTQSRELLGRGFLVPPMFEEALHTHHTSVVRFSERNEIGLLLWAQLQSTEFRERAKGFATGTTVAALPPEAVLDFEVAVPADLDAALAAARAAIEKSWQLENERAQMVSVRRALLPELLSGRVRVSGNASPS